MAAAALCAFFPNVWFFGGTAFSDMTSLTLVVFAVALLLRGGHDARAYVAGALLLAAAAAIRPQNLLIGLAPAVLAGTGMHVPARQVLLAAAGAILVLAAAYVPAVMATGGVGAYMTALRIHSDYITRVDSFRSPTRPPLWRLFDDFFLRQYQSPVLGWIVTLFVVVSLIAAVRARGQAHRHAATHVRPIRRLGLADARPAEHQWLLHRLRAAVRAARGARHRGGDGETG